MAIDFDGTDDALKTTTNVLRHSTFSATNYSFTVSCWIKPDAAQSATIWAQQQDDGQTQGRLVLEMISSNRKFKIRFQNSSATSGNNAYGTDYTVWYHLVATFAYDASVGRHLYLNGNSTPIASKTSSNRSSLHEDNDLDFLIGAGLATSSPYGHTAHFNGQIAEVCAWKTILSAGEITSLYNGASPLFVRPNQILSYYPMGGPYVGSSADANGAYRDIIGGNGLTETSSPAFAATPILFKNTGQGMFYPSAMGVLNNTVPYVAPGGGGGGGGGSFSTSSSKGTYTESGISGGDVLHEIVESKLRWQGGRTVNNGGVSFFSTGNSPEMFIDGTSYVSILNNRLVEANRQNQEDEIHGGSKD